MNKINIVDVGARYGLHPSFKSIQNLSHCFLFEPEPVEFKRLSKKYSDFSNFSVFDLALTNKIGTINFFVSQHRALSRIVKTGDFVENKKYKSEEFEIVDSILVQTQTLDNFFNSDKIDFLKIDVEGSEIQLLEGAVSQLENNIIGVRSEVTFTDVYGSKSSFSEINDKLLNLNFQLLNLDYDGKGHPFSKFVANNKYGKLVSTDAVWIKSLDNFSFNIERTLKLILFCLINNGSDLAIHLLKELSKTSDLNVKFQSNPIYVYIKKEIALIFKNLLNTPYLDLKEICDEWETIFKENFPTLDKFWSSYDL